MALADRVIFPLGFIVAGVIAGLVAGLVDQQLVDGALGRGAEPFLFLLVVVFFAGKEDKAVTLLLAVLFCGLFVLTAIRLADFSAFFCHI